MTRGVHLTWGVRIPMRDGVTLGASLYEPAPGSSAPSPCVAMLTPYGADSGHDIGTYFAQHGFRFVVADVRGRGNSEGEFRAFIQEAGDGHDLVEWLARQPFCSGKVAMHGGSYSGYAQWAAAKERPAHLATIVPAASPYLGLDFPMRNNIFYPYILQWLTLTAGRATQAKLASDEAFWSALYRKWCHSGRAFRDLSTVLGQPSGLFQEWLDHPEPDSYWDEHNPTDAQYAQMQIPILTITGIYDDDQPGALAHYRQFMRSADASARSRHYLIIGPWDHAGTRTPQSQVGGLGVGPAGLLDLCDLHLEWYTWTMGHRPKPAFLERPVAYYLTGAERWKYADTLEQATAQTMELYLERGGAVDDVLRSGRLQRNVGSGGPDVYRFDPGESHEAVLDVEAQTPAGTLTDQSMMLALARQQLVYHTDPFAQATEITGSFSLTAWISIDTPDTDFYASVYEIDAAGGSIRLSSDALRARYRRGLRSPELIQTRDPLRYEFKRFTFTSRLIKRGSRLRLVIAPMGRLIEAAFTERNFNGGGPVASETRERAAPVTVRLYHDAARPSALSVPLGAVD